MTTARFPRELATKRGKMIDRRDSDHSEKGEEGNKYPDEREIKRWQDKVDME